MRRAVVLGAAVALSLVACGGDDDKPTVGASGATPTTMAMAEHHTDHVGNPTSTCTPSGSTVAIAASGTKFDKDCLAAPASQTFTINYDNKDSTQHALRPGTYAFHCERHPSATSGTFIVK